MATLHPGMSLLPSAPHSRSASAASTDDDLSDAFSYPHPFPVVVPSSAVAAAAAHAHSRQSSSASSYSLASTNLTSPADSPPGTLPTSKPPHAASVRASHLRARAAASPYPREHPSHSGSDADPDDLAMYLSTPVPEYQHHPAAGYMAPSALVAHHPGHGHHPHPHEAAAAAASFGRMTLSADITLEHLANNVRQATTTSASDRAKQIFVQAWLTANYATYPDGNVPRQGLYFSYRRVCDQYSIPHINTATLGKAIRLCFPNIKTRRLGVRGNSKYHYCGIRPATATEAEYLQEYIRRSNNHAGLQSATMATRMAGHPAGAAAGQAGFLREGSRSGDDEDDEDGDEEASSGTNSKRSSLQAPLKSPILHAMDISDKTPTAQSHQHQPPPAAGTNPPQIRRRSLGPPSQSYPHAAKPPSAAAPAGGPPFDGRAAPSASSTASVRALPNFPAIEEALGANSSSPQGVVAREVWRWFEDHLDSLLESVRSFRFDQFEIHLRTFWASLQGDHREVVHAPAVAGLMARADAMVYDEILESLRSQVLSPIPPHSLTSLRQLADKMEKILLMALENYGATFVEPKVELGARFGHLVLRFLDIFQVTQALQTVLTNAKQLADMRRSWQNVDFESVRNQSALVCNCRHEDLVQLLEVDFSKMLESLATVGEPVRIVMGWADDICERLMGRGGAAGGSSEERSTMSSRSVLIRWGYVTSQIMRDLTIRSDPAFGAFQILKLFLDDWIALNVLRSVALSTNSVAASVEPVIQQQFFTLSPMAGQESFSTSASSAHGSSLQAHTPTTTSMLAALNDPFPAGALDPNATSFGAASSYHPLSSYMEATSTHGDVPFGDYVPSAESSFDVSSFAHDLSDTTQQGDDVVEEPVKEENA